MNPVVEYAIAHRHNARNIAMGSGFSRDDAEDIAQNTILRIWRADPNGDNPAHYWHRTVKSAMMDFVRRDRLESGHALPILADIFADERQDPERLASDRETLRQVVAICSEAERALLATQIAHGGDRAHRIHRPSGERALNGRERVALHRLRRRLRAAGLSAA